MRSRAFKTILCFSVILISCKTYYIPIESFKSQFKNETPITLKSTMTRGPWGGLHVYPANRIHYIKCQDKKGFPYILENTPSIEIRFTDKNNKRTVFYFDGLYVSDSLIIGDRSRFISAEKAISINNIKLIEVQDGHKNFTTVK
jgi:hypothetical protein